LSFSIVEPGLDDLELLQGLLASHTAEVTAVFQ